MKWNSPPFFVVMSVICLVRQAAGGRAAKASEDICLVSTSNVG